MRRKKTGRWLAAGLSVLLAAACNQIADIGVGFERECTKPSECKVEEPACRSVVACEEGRCIFKDEPAGTPRLAQVPGDCAEEQCDGQGGKLTVFVAGDVEDDGQPCTLDLCLEVGKPTHAPLAEMACYEGDPWTLGKGICRAGVQRCMDGQPDGRCDGQMLPKKESCYTIFDDDCDGQVNEEGAGCKCEPGKIQACYLGSPATKDVGACHVGKQSCSPDGSGYGSCVGAQMPQPETCDVAMTDEDCDGFSNESGANCVCGDGFVSRDIEDCDDGDHNNKDGCSSTCFREVKQIVTGVFHTCALILDGSVKCWGDNDDGELGLGDKLTRGNGPGQMGALLPAVDLGPGKSAQAIAAGGFHTCALLAEGTVKCWGYNGDGQLGLGDTLDRGDDPGEMGDNLKAVDLGPGKSVQAIAAGYFHTCALLAEGTVKCWGRNNAGQLGLGDTLYRGDEPGEMGDALPAVDLGAGKSAQAIAAGESNTCALLAEGTVKCWGLNDAGQLGLGDTLYRGDEPGEMGDALPAIDLGAGKSAQAIARGYSHTCALLAEGTVKCWGLNDAGQLGLGDTLYRGDEPGEMGDALPAIDLGAGKSAQAIAGGYFHTCALLAEGTVKCWGRNNAGQLGLGDTLYRGDEPGEMGDALPAVDLGAGKAAQTIAGGYFHTCALLAEDTVKCWGANFEGQLGLGDQVDRGDEPGEMGDALPRSRP